MARNSIPRATGRPRRRVRRRGGSDDITIIYLLIVLIMAMTAVSWQAATMAIIGLVPTFVLAFSGRDADRSTRLQTVAFLNLAGTLPVCLEVYQAPNNFTNILQDPITLTIIWGCAGLAYLLLLVGPMVAAVVLQALAQDDLKKLNVKRQNLIDSWGPEVAQTPPPAANRPGASPKQDK